MEGDVERANEANDGRGGAQAATRARTGVSSARELGRQTLTGRGDPRLASTGTEVNN